MRWPLRPKQHQFEHLIFDFGVWVNPRHFSCMLDEDLIGRLKKITTHTHPKTMSVRALEHYAICVASLWVGDLFGWNGGGKKNCLGTSLRKIFMSFSCVIKVFCSWEANTHTYIYIYIKHYIYKRNVLVLFCSSSGIQAYLLAMPACFVWMLVNATALSASPESWQARHRVRVWRTSRELASSLYCLGPASPRELASNAGQNCCFEQWLGAMFVKYVACFEQHLCAKYEGSSLSAMPIHQN